MIEAARELIQYRHLLLTLAWREIRIRYKETVMGFLWAIFMPMMVVAAGLLVRKALSVVSGKPMEFTELISVMVKSLPWAFFAGSIRTASSSLLVNSNLVTKIYFPREVFPFSAVLAQLFDLAVATSLLVVLVAFSGLSIGIQILWLPLLLVLLILLAAGLGLFLSCATLFFRDVKYIVEIVMTFGILFTPVFYEASMFGEWSYVLLLNPVGSILEAINDVVVLNRAPHGYWLLYAASWAVGSFILAWLIFEKAEPAFAESI
jgi:ABC-type polysaccharide/polyol phosphate export permease